MNVNFLTVYIIFVICFFVPSTAFAYLDPGTGNALIYVLLSLGGAVIYVAKNAYYKITCNSKKKNKTIADSEKNAVGFDSDNNIVLFNEGRIYWNTFKPVVEALIYRKRIFCLSQNR